MLIFKQFDFKTLIDKYLNEKEIFSYCLQCENFNRNYSCPPHEKPLIDFYKKYSYAEIYLYKYTYSEDLNIDDVYINTRKYLDRAIFAYENTTHSIALIPGRCILCTPCYKELSQPCPYPNQIRHSFETIGFNLSNLIKDEFQQEFKWNSNEILFIFGFLSSNILCDKFNDYL